MEGANEAARRAVNAILDASRSSAHRCDVWPLREPPALGPARTLDKLLWKLSPPGADPAAGSGDGGVEPRNLLSRALLVRRAAYALTRVRPASATPASSASRP